MKSHLDEILEKASNKLIGGMIGLFAFACNETPSKVTEQIGEKEMLEVAEEFDKNLRTSLISLMEKYGEEVERIYMDLYKEKSVKNYNEIGVDGVYGYNLALDEFSTKLKEIL